MNGHIIRQLLNKPPIYCKLIGLLDLGGIWRKKKLPVSYCPWTYPAYIGISNRNCTPPGLHKGTHSLIIAGLVQKDFGLSASQLRWISLQVANQERFMDQTWNHIATSWVTYISIVKKMFHGPGKWPWDLYIFFHVHMDSCTDMYFFFKFWKIHSVFKWKAQPMSNGWGHSQIYV